MTNFPGGFDDDTTLPFVNDNITEIGGDAINALRDATFALEQNIGIGAAGSAGSIAARLGVSINPDGSIKPSAIASMGLVTLPITNGQIADNAQIPESKLRLDHRTQDLFNYIQDLSLGVNKSLGWISTTGIKLDPHLLGAIYRHTLDQIDVSANTTAFLKNKFELLRNNTNAYTLINDINNELLFHQFADGSPVAGTSLIITNDGSTYPSNYAHTASGIWINTSRFAIVPQTAQDLQSFAEFIDNSSILLYGTRIQNFYSNGISRVSRSSSLLIDGYGVPIVPETPAIAYLLNIGGNSSPFDDIDAGDDIIELKPAAADLSSNSFDEKFALVKVGDIIRINYGSVEVPFIIKEKKYRQNLGVKKFLVRIAGKNLFYAPNATARIDRSLVNSNKYGVLAIAAANNAFDEIPSLIIGSPRGAQALGLGFNPDQFDNAHYNLFLALFPTGHPTDGYTLLPAIDITGNQGATPGLYTLDSIVNSTNAAFRQVGYNYRFIAFSYQGEFGIMLADSYNNAGFSVLNGVVDGVGTFNQTATQLEFPNNAIDIFAADGYTPVDPLGFGSFGSGIASPPYLTTYTSAEAALQATKLFLPLKRNNYYVNGVEKEKLNLEVDQILDTFGDGYWFGTIHAQTLFPGAPPTGRVETTYRILLDLSSSGLKEGKTLVIQSLGQGSLVDFGRFIIKSITFNVCEPNIYTDITVYDAVHATGISPVATLGIGAEVGVYFSSDSVSFNRETATDFNGYSPFKRHFEVYVDGQGETFTHERARINISGSTMVINDSISLFGSTEINKLNIVKVSPKLRGYQFGSVNKITLRMLSYDESLGVFDGYLASYDGVTFTHPGPIVTGRKGQITRFYDETFNDYIDIMFDVNIVVSTFVDRVIDFQLFPTLSLDDEVMMLATCQMNDSNNTISMIRDERQFGNTSEKDLSTSALNFISLPERLLHSNGVIRGFDLVTNVTNPNSSQVFLSGGVCLVNGKVIQINDETVVIPPLKELIGVTLYNINWLICVNDKGEYQPIPLLDQDVNITITTLNPSRVFKAYNVVNGSSYNLDATTFSNMINKRKDLTPVYLIRSVVTAGTPPIFNLTITDVRKYINDADSNLPLRLTVGDAQGNFRDVESILAWIRFNGQFNGVAFVRGASVSTGTIDDDITLNFANNITFDGENNATLTFNGHVTIGTHVTFKNMEINFNGGVTILSGTGDINFEKCVINYNANLTGITNAHYSFNFSNCSIVRFTDTIINAVYNFPVINSALFKIDTTSEFKMFDCLINISFTATPGVSVPGDVFWISNSVNVDIGLTNVFGNFDKCFNLIENCSGFKLKDAFLQSSYNPTLDGFYNTLDVVNTGSGYIYSNIIGILDGIEIDNCFFNYTPAVASENRFCFINFELSTIFSALSDSSIKNCRFSDTNTGSNLDGYRAAIGIINITPSTISPNFQPLLYNVDISDNACNKNQAIIVSSQTLNDGYQFDGYTMSYPGLAAIDVSIDKNVCGTIGYWISDGTKIVNLPGAANNLVDKSASLVISKNTCHYIASMTGRGQYFRASRRIFNPSPPAFSSTVDTSPYASGYVTISDNTANWIHTGISLEEDSALNILNNNLVAYDQKYIGKVTSTDGIRYGDSILGAAFSGITFGYNMAISVVGSAVNVSPFGNDGSVIIRGNTTSPGYFVTPTAVPVTYYYGGGYIYCQSSNHISQNFLRGFSPLGSSGYGIMVGGIVNMISQNRIYRTTGSFNAYVVFTNPDSPTWNFNFARGTIIDNYFDSPFIAGTTDTTVSLPAAATRWIVDRNINQTVYVSIPMTNSQFIEVIGSADSFGGANYNWAAIDNQTSIPPTVAVTTGHTDDTFLTTALNQGNVQYRSNVVRFSSNNLAQHRFGWQENLDKYLAPGARLIEAKMTIKTFIGSTNFDNASYVVMSLNEYTNPIDALNLSFSTPSSNDTKVLNNTNIVTSPPVAPTGTQAYAVVNGATINASGGFGLGIPLDIVTENINASGSDISDLFISNKQGAGGLNNGFGISIDAFLVNTNGSGQIDLILSPILIKYRW